jgi:hypothetical protein
MTAASSAKPIAMPMRPGMTNVAAGVSDDTLYIAAANTAASGTGGTLSSSECMRPNAPVQRRAAQRTVRCNRLLAARAGSA